jgi:hypothetical protein
VFGKGARFFKEAWLLHEVQLCSDLSGNEVGAGQRSDWIRNIETVGHNFNVWSTKQLEVNDTYT